MLTHLSFIALNFAMLTLGTPIRRDANQVMQDLQNLDQQSQALSTSVNAFPNSGGTLLQVWAIREAASQLDNSVKSTTNDVNASDYFDDAQATTLLQELENNLEPDIKQGFDGLVAKKSAVASFDMDSTIESGLKTLQTDVDALWSAIVVKSPVDMQSTIQNQLNTINTHISSAINAYST